MKHYQSYIIAAVALTLASCADDKFQEMQTVAPARNAEYAYLNDYADLKSYVQHSTYPAFQLGGAVDGAKFNKREMDYSLAVANFEELVTGNTMKMGSIVNDKGIFDFTTTENFVNNATDAGLSVYGHTLCWHEQQPVKWLNSLIADRPVEVDPEALQEVSIHECDYADHASYPWYRMSDLPQVENGVLVIDNPTAVADWQVQYFVDDQVPTVVGEDYVIRVTIKASAEGSLKCNVGDWGGASSTRVKFTTEWETVDCTVKAVPAASSFVVFQSGDFVGKIEVKKVEVLKLEVPPVAVIETVLHECDYANHASYPWYRMSDLPQVEDGVLVIDNPTAVADWQVQYFVDDQIPTEKGADYVVRTTIRGSKEGSVKCNVGDWNGVSSGRVKITTEWETVDTKVTEVPASSSFVVFQSGDYVGKIEIKKVQFIKQTPSNVIPLTDEEKKDTLTWAMDKWIKGMMEACDGKVKAFDAINEPVDGWGAPVDGVLPLQHANPEKPDDTKFYWQDYLGDEEYVRTVIKLARQYGPEDIKLFINDYALEGYVVEGKYVYRPKLESLIKWIEKWESDGVTKIDGIGTQMHVYCFEDDAENQKMMDGIAASFQKMAETDKFIRISELDMGYIDASGNSVKTADMTEDGHKKMAKLYNFVVSKYLEIIPSAQQWGICAWGVTDQPSDSGWRPGEPTGLWEVRKVGDESGIYYRKHTYAGFATGLAGQEYEAGK